MSIQEVIHTGKSYLRDNHMSPEQIDMDAGVEKFLAEMQSGLKGSGSSLPMIPTYINAEGSLPLHTPVLVLDAGGTNFRVAKVEFDGEGRPLISDFSKSPMPGSRGYMDKESFFSTIVEYMQEHLEAWKGSKPPDVGFCFSYPTEISPDHDGRLIHFSKEIKAPEVEGEYIGAGLQEALKKRGYPLPSSMVLLNDTVATLLAGKAASTQSDYDGFIGFILGTGTNSAYIEANSNIHKLPSLPQEGSQIINVESGNMDKIDGGRIDTAFDANTKSPGHYRFEKMVSGAYLGPLGGLVLRQAAEDGIFSASCSEGIGRITAFDTILVDHFLQNPSDAKNPIASACREESDRVLAYVLLDAIAERAAKLAAINLSATVVQGGGGSNPTKPVAICADGTTFYKTKDMLFRTRAYLASYLREKQGRYVKLIHQDNAPIIGSAVAALLNR